MLGWLLGASPLLDWLGTGIEIKANTAIGILFAAGSLAVSAYYPRWKIVACALALPAAGIGAATMFQHLTGVDLGIDTLIFNDNPNSLATSSPGRMGIPASTSLTLLGVGLFLLHFTKRLRMAASLLGFLTLTVTSLSLFGYFFGANQLYSIAKYTGIAFQTASMLAILAVGLAWSVPEQGVVATFERNDTGGLVFRRLIVPAIVSSLVLGWLRIRGQKLELYDTEFGTAMRTLAEILLLLFFLWRTTESISKAEAETRLLSRLPAENPNPVVRLSSSGEVLYQNDASKRANIDWDSGNDPVVEGFRDLARRSLAANEKIETEIEIGDRCFSCTFAPILESSYVNVYAADITERKRSEAELSQRMRELGVLYRFTDQLNHVSNIDDVYNAGIKAINEAFGFTRSSILLFDDKGVMSFVAWSDLSEEYRRAVNGHSPWTAETPNPRPFGISDVADSDIEDSLKKTILDENIAALAFIPLISNGRLIGKFMIYSHRVHTFDENQLELGMSIANQIAFGVENQRSESRRRATEAALRENDARLRLVTRTGKVGVWDWDIIANRVSWTESLYTMHGITESGFDNTPDGFVKLVHKDDKKMVSAAIEKALAGDAPYEIEFRTKRPDGKTVWLYTNATVLRDGNEPLRMIGATIDVTERKLAELETGKLAAIVESSTDAIISKTLNAKITSWNRAAERMFGYTADEAVGHSITMLIPEDRLNEEAEILHRIRNNETVEHYETVRKRKDGQLIDVSLTISPIIDSKGIVIGASKIARDVTGQKAAAAAVRESEIMRSIVDAQESERHRIARDLHDHLGQQLTALRFKLEAIKTKAAGQPELLAEIDEGREQASRIDLDINFLSWELRPTELDTLGLRDALGSFVREWSASHGIAAEFHSSESKNGRLSPEIETNLYRIVQEGLNNILKHAKATKVSVLLENRSSDTLLIIEDNGIGFDLDADVKKKRDRKGGGLGLVGMRERTALLGGTLEIETNPGKGTSVFARIPISKANGSSSSY